MLVRFFRPSDFFVKGILALISIVVSLTLSVYHC